MPRLFTGIEIPPEITLALSQFRGGLPGARWVDPENYHLTLRFIGDIDDRMADDVTSVLGETRARHPLGITIDGQRKSELTNRRFVTTVGTHEVQVARTSKPCRVSVAIDALQTSVVTCE